MLPLPDPDDRSRQVAIRMNEAHLMTIRTHIPVAWPFRWAFAAVVFLAPGLCCSQETGGLAPCMKVSLCSRACADCRNTCCCPDDYHPKCPPVEPCRVPGCGKPCYCGKRLPCVPPVVRQGCCDDYCAKPFSLTCRSLCEPWFTCGPPEAGCGCTRHRTIAKPNPPRR